ncbi:Protein transport protein SEC23 [Entamoeba marina]
MDIDQIEQQDGVRLSWNVWPSTKTEAEKYLDIPLGLVYQPLRGTITEANQIEYNNQPIRCQCGAYVNPWCFRDNSYWSCPFCNARNQAINDDRMFSHSTVEYVIIPQAIIPTTLLFVIDTTAPQQEIDSLKTSITLTLATLPSTVQVGLMVFGKHISIYDMTNNTCPRAYILSGQKSYSATQLTSILSSRVINQLLAPLNEWPVENGKRSLRCTGAALSAASSLLESRNICGSMNVFVSGPCTFGPGIVVSDDLKEQMRTHTDISQERIKYLEDAQKYYKSLADKLAEKMD